MHILNVLKVPSEIYPRHSSPLKDPVFGASSSVPPPPSCLSPLEGLEIRRLYGLRAVFKVKYYLWTAGKGTVVRLVLHFFQIYCRLDYNRGGVN